MEVLASDFYMYACALSEWTPRRDLPKKFLEKVYGRILH